MTGGTKRRMARTPLALVPVLALPLAACGGTTDFGPAPKRLDDAEYALYFSAQSQEIDGEGHHGRLVLVGGDGAVSVLPTGGMDVGQPVWTEQGLFFSDLWNDYRLDRTGLTTIGSAKADYQYAMLAPSPSTAVGIYNLGFSDAGGYTSQVVVTSGERSTLTEVEGGYYITASCDGTVYGAGMATGPYSVTGDPETEPVMLNQLTDTAHGHERNIGLSERARDNALRVQAPCEDGMLVYISDAIGGGFEAPVKPVVSMWDVHTGEYRELPMTADELEEPLMRSDGVGSPQVTAESMRDGRLQWFGVNDSIMSTDLKTGRTEKQFEVAGVTDDELSSQAVFHEDEVIVLVDSAGANPYEVVRYDRDTGAVLSQTILEASAEEVAAGLFLRGFAIRP